MQLADNVTLAIPPLPVKQVPESSYSNALPLPDPLGVWTPNGFSWAVLTSSGSRRSWPMAGHRLAGPRGAVQLWLRVPCQRPSACV